MIRLGAVLLALVVATAGFAVEPDEILDDAALESRARALSKELRCVVCQNQDIDSSNAGVARDLRLLVRERLLAGDSDEEVLDFIVARYGNYVLFSPPVKPSTYLLWYGPIALLLFGALASGVAIRRGQRRATPEPLSNEDETLLADYLKKGGEDQT